MTGGLYSSFQQAWQERAPLAVHRVETSAPHACLEVEVAAGARGLDVRVVADRQREVAREVWRPAGAAVALPPGSFFSEVTVTPRGLSASVARGPWAAPTPYRLLRARPFRGWVEVPADGPYDPETGSETAYRRSAGLRLHDQGGLAEVPADAAGRPLAGQPLAVELTQLVYARSLEVLKLAVYAMPASAVTYDSHAVAYAWAEPGASRLGLNLRDVVTGWTLDTPGLGNSDDPGTPRSSAGTG